MEGVVRMIPRGGFVQPSFHGAACVRCFGRRLQQVQTEERRSGANAATSSSPSAARPALSPPGHSNARASRLVHAAARRPPCNSLSDRTAARGAVVTTSAAVAKPTWEDAETLEREEEWTEFTLNADARGAKLYLEIDGNADLNFAEVVFENGDVQVVDFEEKNHKPGLYSLLDFKDGRKIDHVRLMARARTKEARVALVMAK
jgi:hypothetical protein